MEKNKRMQFYGGTLGACAPLLVFMCLMIVIAAMKKVSLVLFCMAGFAGLCVAFLLAKNKKEFEQAVVDGLKNDTLCVIIFAFLLAGILSQELRQSGLIQGLTWLVMKLGLSAGFLPLVAFLVCLLISTACGTSNGAIVAVLPVLLLRSLGVFGTPSAAETTPTPAPTAPVETAVPTETPTPTPTPKPEPTYEVVKADVSWADAEAAAEAKGGHLVVIDSAEKWTRVAQLADESGLTYVWIGLYRADSGELAWVKDNIDPVYNWAAGEPSVRDTNGAAENYVLIARRSDGWYYNDCIGDPAAKYPQFYGGKTGYIIEIDP